MTFKQDEFTTNQNFLIQARGESNILIFFTSINTLPTPLDSLAVLYTLSKLGFYKLFEELSPGNIEFIIDLDQDEIVIDKHTASIFINTGFKHTLRHAGIVTVVFTGTATEFEIESSNRDAFNRGFYTAVVSDCISSPNKKGLERSLGNINNYINISSLKEFQKI